MNNEKEIVSQPHHEQQSLCTTRLPYRQGRKLTAVKAYSVTKESNHLLIFGVPSLNIRQETKAIFMNFGKLLQFTISTQHPAELFTETYHAQFEQINSARLAKRMLDTNNFYGGSLHVCYAPELESINETKQKIMKRQQNVTFRLKNLRNEVKIASESGKVPSKITKVQSDIEKNYETDAKKLNMGEENTIHTVHSRKRKKNDHSIKKFQPSLIHNEVRNDDEILNYTDVDKSLNEYRLRGAENVGNKVESGGFSKITNHGQHNVIDHRQSNNSVAITNSNTDINTVTNAGTDKDIEVVDCTSVDKETITNINEHLNYNKFGNEVVRKVPIKPLNRIKFNFNK